MNRIETLVVGPFQENTYVVGDDSRCVVVDPGDEAARILVAVGGRRVDAVLLTHGHADHIGALDEVRDATGAPAWCPRADATFLADPALNLSEAYGLTFTRRPAERLYDDGAPVGVPPLIFRAIHTPGHTPGSSALLLEPNGPLLAGDTLFAGSVGRTDLPGGDGSLLLASIRDRLLSLPDDLPVLPGHGPATTIGTERRFNPFLR